MSSQEERELRPGLQIVLRSGRNAVLREQLEHGWTAKLFGVSGMTFVRNEDIELRFASPSTRRHHSDKS